MEIINFKALIIPDRVSDFKAFLRQPLSGEINLSGTPTLLSEAKGYTMGGDRYFESTRYSHIVIFNFFFFIKILFKVGKFFYRIPQRIFKISRHLSRYY